MTLATDKLLAHLRESEERALRSAADEEDRDERLRHQGAARAFASLRKGLETALDRVAKGG